MAGPLFMLKGRIWPPAQITTSFATQTIIVTGSNTGVGYQAALKFAELDAAKVILAVRTVEKGQRAKDEILQTVLKYQGIIEVWELDMDSYESIDAFAKRVDRELERLDVAVLNAGVLAREYTASSQGWEKMLQVNTLSTALLAILLLPKLKASKSERGLAHLTVVVSTGHKDVTPMGAKDGKQLHAYNSENNFSMYTQYCISKLFMMWIDREIAARCVGPAGEPLVIVNDVCPGACRSDVLRDFNNPVIRVLKSIGSFLMLRPAERGSRTLVGAACMGIESHGRWWVNDAFDVPGEYITNQTGKQMQHDIWTEVMEVLKKKVPRVESAIEDPAYHSNC